MIMLLGAFLIPIVTSSLNGLTHVLTCRQQAEVPFTVITPPRGQPTVVSSSTLIRGQPEGVCGGLVFDLGVGSAGPGKVRLDLPITNKTDFDWHGTERLRMGPTVIPIKIGEIRHGQTRRAGVVVNVTSSQLELKGSLLLGP
jgi:hypothetical protein